jgi:hypothetical protein
LLLLATTVTASPERDAANQHYSAGQRAFEDGDFAKAADELKASVAAKPTVRALLTLGNTYIKLGQLDDAKAAFARILEVDPKSSKRKQVETLIRNLDTLAKTRLVITTTPPGATVYLDMKADGSRGKTPVTVPALPGRHRVILEMDNYEPSTQADVMAVEGQDVPVTATLRAKGCDASIDAEPAARISIDGGQGATAPVTARLMVGEHLIAFTQPGYVDKQRTVSCEVDKPLTLKETLDRIPMATLALHAPDGAHVDIDDKAVRDPKHVELPPGQHRVSIDGGKDGKWSATLTLQNGASTEITPSLLAPAPANQPNLDVIVADRQARRQEAVQWRLRRDAEITAGVIFTVLGVAAGGVGLYYLKAGSDGTNAIRHGGLTSAQISQIDSSVDTDNIVAYSAGIPGGVFTAIGLPILIAGITKARPPKYLREGVGE